MVLKVNIGKRWWGQRVVALLLAGLIPFLVISDVFSQDGVDAGESLIDFSFDQVEISAFVKVVGGITGHRFVVSDDVKGRITVVAPRVKQSEAYGLFVSVLESAGCSVIKRGDIYHIVRLSDSSTTMAPVVGPGTRTTGEGLITKVLRPEYVNAGDVKKALEFRMAGSKLVNISVIDDTNHILITDTAENIRRIEDVISQIDKPGLKRVTEVINLEHAGSEDLAAQLNAAIFEAPTRGEALSNRLPNAPGAAQRSSRQPLVIPSAQGNRLLLVGTQDQIDELKGIIARMDTDQPSGKGRLNAVFLKYLDADEAATNISAILIQSGAQQGRGAGDIKIAIEASKANNALLVNASPSDLEVVKKLIEQLDHPPEQVQISVQILEHSLSEDLNLGIEMAAIDMPSGEGDTVIQGGSSLSEGTVSLMNSIQEGIFPGGITVGAAHGTGINAEGGVISSYPAMLNINALKQDGRFELLSESSLEVQNNKEAILSIVNEIPILKSTIEGGSGTARDIIQNIERVDVGIKLKLTPHIIPDGGVQMTLNPSIEAVIDAGPSETQFAPTIARREVATTVTVGDGRTIVIAGLTRTDKKEVVKKVPVLGSIPLLGMLFRSKVNTTEKTDLLILVTPRIVTGVEESDKALADWKAKTGLDSDSDE